MSRFMLNCSSMSDREIKQYISTTTKLYILAIDPGVKNLCIRIERRHRNKVTTILYELVQLSNTKYRQDFDSFVSRNREIILRVNLVIIESQVIRNVKMMSMMSYLDTLFSYYIFSLKDSNLNVVKIFGAKYTQFNIPTKSITKRERKNHLSPAVAIRILELYELYDDADKLESSLKKDDYSDVVMLIESFFYKYDTNCVFHTKIGFGDIIEEYV